MLKNITQGEQNLFLLKAMIPRNEPLYVWCYDADGKKKGTTCPELLQEALDHAFRGLGGLEKAQAYAALPESRVPLLIGSSIGMQWAVTLEAEREKNLLFVIGPVFYQKPDEKKLRDSLLSSCRAHGDTGWIGELLSVADKITVLSYSVFSRYVIMVHNTLTGQQLGLEDLASGMPEESDIQENTTGERNRLNIYLAEKALLDMVRQGNINYQSALRYSSGMSPGVPIEGKDPLRQMKTSIIVFTTLVSRAAMEGGLSPEVAYSLGDSYIQTAENSRDSGELSALATAMYHDFIYRVHYLHANPNYSHAVQKCCDYIELSLDRKISTADLAGLVGYTEYYLTEKFKKETGRSVSSYIRDAKIERAKMLLQTTDLPVSEIAVRLAFNTPNYFIHCFHDVVGCTPAQYRKVQQKG
ncbi:MAG: helix-turn-helix transcriptional regulator [Clostridia bacterium]|nr:helix-turn-helix transcriptional regulator [Clostridia bacterium]